MKAYICLLLSCISFLFAESDSNNQVLIRRLKGLIFYGENDSVKLNGELNFSGIKTEDVFIPDEQDFMCIMKGFLGKEITEKEIQTIRTKIIDYYKKHNYSFVVVNMPSGQNITTGVLRVLVVQGRLGTVKAEGARYFSNDKIKERTVST